MGMIGRPTVYNKEIHITVLELFYEGRSITEICRKLFISRQTFYRWVEEHKEFSDTYRLGLDFSQGWWEEQGREALYSSNDPLSQKINPSMWFMNMKNRFREDWKDKHEEKGESESVQTEYDIRSGLYDE